MQDTSDGKYTVGTFDFGTVSAPGGNCIGLPGPRAVAMVGVDATFVGNFWGANVDAPPTGSPGSPVVDTFQVSGGKIDTGAALTTAPSTCGRTQCASAFKYSPGYHAIGQSKPPTHYAFAARICNDCSFRQPLPAFRRRDQGQVSRNGAHSSARRYVRSSRKVSRRCARLKTG